MQAEEASKVLQRLVDQIETVIVGKRSTIQHALIAMVANGHLLIEDVPGVGKTMLARAIARSIAGEFRRIQFTPDLLPADITGTGIFNQKTAEFEFRQGPIFANVVLADEINRATPKTQSSLLEAMEEFQVSADGVTRALPDPFFVIATQNNIEHQGTFPLPEAQLDRFVMRLSMGYPTAADEVAILGAQSRTHPILNVQPVVTAAEIGLLKMRSRQVIVSDPIREYIVDLVSATRDCPDLSLGASPRGSLDLAHASQALALLRGREHVLPDDAKELAVAVLAHRVILHPEARLRRKSRQKVVEELLTQVPVPIEEAA